MSVCRCTVEHGVATILLDSPGNGNALNMALTTALRDHLDDLGGREDVRVIVIGSTGRVFSAGWDLDQSPADGLLVDDVLVEVLESIRTGSKPVIAKIGGHAVGGALGLVAACDLSVASRAARFGFAEARLGLAPTTAAVHCVPKMRLADALELILTGERFGADRAVEVGLVNRAVDADGLDAAVDQLVESVLLGGPIALAACKTLARSITHTGPDAYALAAHFNRTLVGSPEATEGIAAFGERRPPAWVSDAVRGASTATEADRVDR